MLLLIRKHRLTLPDNFESTMKKTKLVFIALIISAFCLPLQTVAQAFEKGNSVVGLGVGFGGAYGITTFGSQSPAFSLNFEHGQWEVGGPGVISWGAYIGTKSYKYDYNYTRWYSGAYHNYYYKQTWRYTVIGARAAYHFNGLDVPKLDVYGGAMLSYNIASYKYEDNDPDFDYVTKSYGSVPGVSLFVGGRYFFTDNFGAYSELGYGASYLTIGLCLKF